jgi:hypothetical protein
VTLAHFHAAALAILATLGIAAVFGREVKQIPSGINPVLSLLAGTFLGFVVILVWRATRRVPRTSLSVGSLLVLVLSGIVVGFGSIPCLAMAFVN